MKNQALEASNPLRRKLLATTILAGLASSPPSLAFAQTAAPETAGGAIALPEVEVERNTAGGAGCGEYGGAPCSGFGGAGLAQDPYNTSYVLPDASTGTKTDTPVMDTPLNVQSITQQVLKDQQAITLDQALNNFSGVFVGAGTVGGLGTPGARFNIRGFQAETYYRDGFRVDSGPLQSDNNSNTQLADVASIEVLKGPGAILYGLSEPGGVINLATKEPLNAPYYSVEQQIGSFDNYRTSIDATGPLTDDKSWLYRMNMSYQSNGGFFGSQVDFLREQNVFLAPVVKWNIDPSTWVKLEAEYNQTRHSDFFAETPVINDVFVTIPRSRNYEENAPNLYRELFTAMTWSHEFNQDWSIRQQLAYHYLDDNLPLIGFPLDIVSADPALFPSGFAITRANQQLQQYETTISTNVDITGHIDTFGARHTLLVGGDVYRFTDTQSDFFPEGTSLIDIFNPIHPGIPTPAKSSILFASYSPQLTAGLYLQDQINLPYNFFVLAGARYQYIGQSSDMGPTLQNLTPAARPLVGQAVTPRYGLLWRPQEWVSLYGNYTESFGANTGLVFPGTLAPPSSARSWEAGVKFELLDKRLRATADYFDLTKTNIATPNLMPGFSQFVVVTGEARSKGAELDVQGTLLPGWDVIAAYANQDVRVTSGSGAMFGTAPAGQRFPGVPQNLARLWTTYEFPETMLKGLKIGGGYTYHGSQPYIDAFFGGFANPKFPTLPSYGTVDLMAAYSFKLADARMTAQVNITNLFDRTYYTDALVGSPIATPGFTIGGRHPYGAPFAVLGSLRADYGPSVAAELAPPPPPPVFNWTGIYLGAQIGYAWGDNTGNLAFATPGGLTGGSDLGKNAQGVIGGGHLGYNLQINQWVIGVEGTVDGTSLVQHVFTAVADPTGATPGGSVTGTVRSGILGSIRGRAGIAFDRLLIYGAGGVAFAGFDTDLQISGADAAGPFFASGSRSSTRTGWTAGGGLQYAIDPNWSVGAEYRYSDFGHIRDVPFATVAGLSLADNRHLAQNQVQVGVSYKFDSFAPAPIVAKY